MSAQWILWGLAAVAALVALVALAERFQGAAFGVVLALTAVEATRDFAFSPDAISSPYDAGFYIAHTGRFMTVGGVELRVWDVITAVALTAGVLGARRFRGTRTAAWCVAGLGALVGSGLLAFTLEWGAQPAFNSWRRWLLGYALLLWASTARRAWRWRDLNWLVAAACLMTALGVVEVAWHGLGSAYGWVWQVGVRFNGRPVSESGAAMVLMAAWVLVLSPRRWTPGRAALLVTFIGFVVMTQHRTVWLAAAASVTVWWVVTIVRSRRLIVERLAWTSVAAAWGGFAVWVMFASMWQLRDSLGSGATYQWRLERWNSSIGTARSGLQWLVGGTFGPTPVSVSRKFDGKYAHSLYVWSIETVGLVGLALLVVLIASLCLRPALLAVGSWPLVTGVVALTIGWTYGLPDWLWLPLGICAGWRGVGTVGARDAIPEPSPLIDTGKTAEV